MKKTLRIKAKRRRDTMERSSCERGFLAMSSLLQKIYRATPENDLGSLLSDLNPIRFSGTHISSFPAFEDYRDLYHKERENGKTKMQASYHACIDFLFLYEREFDFRLKGTISRFSLRSYEAEFEKQLSA